LSEALVVTGFPTISRKNTISRGISGIFGFTRAAYGATVRRQSTWLTVACGRFDGFWEEGLNPWDVAAGLLLIEEAGGQVSYYNGEKFSIYAPPDRRLERLASRRMLRILR
jgi:myo-inositol-1(or 4)-monophosphatase